MRAIPEEFCVSALKVNARHNKKEKHMKMKQIGSMLALAAMAVGFAIPTHADDNKKKDKAYPLDKCVVSDEKLDDHGKPYVFKHKGQEVKLCCKDCLKDFKKDPDKYMKKIDEAVAKK